jgi:hypothetical protein
MEVEQDRVARSPVGAAGSTPPHALSNLHARNGRQVPEGITNWSDPRNGGGL